MLVNGASGFTGHYMVELLQARGYGVPDFACDLLTTAAMEQALRWMLEE